MKMIYNQKFKQKIRKIWEKNIPFRTAVEVLLQHAENSTEVVRYGIVDVYQQLEKIKDVEIVGKNEACVVREENVILENTEPRISSPEEDILKTSQKQEKVDFEKKIKNEVKEEALESRQLRIVTIKGDGNCLFRSFSYALWGSDHRYAEIRRNIVEYVKDNWHDHVDILNATCVDFFYNDAEHYCNIMGRDKVLGTDFEIMIFAVLYEVKVLVYKKIANCFKIIGEICPPQENCIPKEHIMVLFSGPERCGHFEVLQYRRRDTIPKTKKKGFFHHDTSSMNHQIQHTNFKSFEFGVDEEIVENYNEWKKKPSKSREENKEADLGETCSIENSINCYRESDKQTEEETENDDENEYLQHYCNDDQNYTDFQEVGLQEEKIESSKREGSEEGNGDEEEIKNMKPTEEKDEKKKKTDEKYEIQISRHNVPASMWKDECTGYFDRESIRKTLRLIFLKNLECPCQLSFRALRWNKKIANNIVGYATCARSDLHIQHFRFEIENLSESMTTINIRSNSELLTKHEESEHITFEQARGKERDDMKEVLKHRSVRNFQLETIKNVDFDMWNNGHPQNLRSVHVLHKIKSEIYSATRLKLQSKDVEDLSQLWIEENKLKDPYLRNVALNPRATMYTEAQLKAVLDDCNEGKKVRIAHFDSTGALVRKPAGVKCNALHLYSLVCRLTESTMPVAELITADHDTESISIFLLQIKNFIIKVSGDIWPFFDAIVVDWSWASMNAIVDVWNKMSIVDYLNMTYECVVNNKIPVNITYLLSCIAHVLHRIAKTIKTRFPNQMSKKNFLMDSIGLILLCRDITQLDILFEDFLRILLTKDKAKAEQAVVFMTTKTKEEDKEIDELNEEVISIEETMRELEIEKEYDILHRKNKAVYTQSKFYKRYYTKFVRIESGFEAEESKIEEEDITNDFYAPGFAEYFTIEFMSYIPICGSLLLNLIDPNISRVSNAYIEAHQKVVKINVLNKQKNNSIGQTVRKLKEYIECLVAEANLGSSAHTKSKIHVKEKPRYPDNASNPFIKDVWKRGKQSERRRENHFQGEEIKRIVKKIMDSKEENEEKTKEENKICKVFQVSKPEGKRRKMQRIRTKITPTMDNLEEKVHKGKKKRVKRQKRKLKDKERIVENVLTSEEDEENAHKKLRTNAEFHFLSNGIIDDIEYYSGSNSNHIKVGKYKIDIDVPLRTKEFCISCKQFKSIVDEKGFANGQIIDAYALTCMKDWDTRIMYVPTDDTRTAIGDYTTQRRQTHLSLYNIDSPLRDILFMPYVYNFHWRLLIVDIKKQQITLLDPFLEATDSDRVFSEFNNFLKASKDSSSFGKLKKTKWSMKEYEGDRPYQSLSDGWNCGLYVMYYMNCLASNQSMDILFDPQQYRRKVAKQLLTTSEDNLWKCLYCLGDCQKEDTRYTKCHICCGKVHENCLPYGELNSDEEKKLKYTLPKKPTIGLEYRCKLCRRYIKNNQIVP